MNWLSAENFTWEKQSFKQTITFDTGRNIMNANVMDNIVPYPHYHSFKSFLALRFFIFIYLLPSIVCSVIRFSIIWVNLMMHCRMLWELVHFLMYPKIQTTFIPYSVRSFYLSYPLKHCDIYSGSFRFIKMIVVLIVIIINKLWWCSMDVLSILYCC